MRKEISELGRETKKNKLLSKYNWIIAEPYYDIVLSNGSTGKSKKSITLREFKQKIEEGQTLSQLQQNGISRHLLQFFSNFLQNKIKLTKEIFEDRYNEGKELYEISQEFNIQRGDLTYLRQLYNIKRKGATFIKRKKNDVPLTQIQKDLIYGSLMGDAKRQTSKQNSSAGFGQSNKQKEYLEWKYFTLKNISTTEGIKKYSTYDERYNKTYISHRFYTLANSDVETIINKFYRTGKKKITKDILDNLSTFSLAVWYMDDGTTDWQHRKIKRGIKQSPEIKICTDSFSLEEVELIISWFKEKRSIHCHWRDHRQGQPRVIIETSSAYDFLNLIRPHIIPSMLYKVDYNEYLKKIESKK